MTCPGCGAVPDGAVKFCLQCGTRLAVACPSCGTPVVPGARFCGECGADVSAAAPATSTPVDAPASAVAERRLVSVLFADLVGFTTLSETRDPEETRELLTEYFEAARVVIARYGGTVEKFIGDAVMAVWGTPVAHEDDAERAVRSALDLVEAVAVLGERAGAPGLRARAGVLTGEAAVTLGASDQGMVAGDLVNTAARLQSAAEPGAVFVGESTRHATATSIGYEDAGTHAMKGKAEPVPAFRAARILSERRGAGRTEQLEAPFTGRQSELRMLKDFLHAVGAERRPRVVSVTGQGGIGKSRLAWELQKYVDGLSEDVYWHHGRCPAYGDGVSFWALGEMVRARAQIAEGEAPQVAAAKLSDMLAEFVPDEAERRWVEPALRDLLGLDGGDGSDGRTSRNQETYFAAWRTFFERIAARGTTALVFEDLQWADPGLLDFLEHLLEWSRGHPLYVVALTRPELVERRPGWGTGWRNFTSLTLEPLSDDAMRELLEGLVPGLPEDVSARIRERAEGVPLYAVETIRKLLAEGRLEAEGSAFRPVGDLSVLAVPETLHALVASRLDALPAVDRSIVQEASVLGKTFTLDALADISSHPQESWERTLRELVRRELFVMDVDPRSPERGQYGFVQDLVREVAYGTLSRRDRRRIHLAAARHFEQHHEEEIAGVIASHYLEAHRAQPDGADAESVAESARAALWAAAERALRLGSHDGALGYFRQALEVARDDADRVELLLAAGRAATEVNRDADADAHVSDAIELARRRGDRLAELRAVTLQGLVRLSLGHSDAAVEPLENAARDFDDHRSTAEYVELTDALSRAYMRTGRHDDSLIWADRGLREAERREMSRVNLELLVTRATVLGGKGRLKEAVATLIGARALASSAGFVDIEARALINLGFVWANDDLRAGLQVSREGAEIALRMGLRSFLAYMVGNGAEVGFQVGAWDVVADLLDRAIAVETEDAATGYLRGFRARMAAARDEPYGADLDLFLAGTPQDDPQGRAALADLEAFVALAEGRLADAGRPDLATGQGPAFWSPPELLTPGRAATWKHDAAPLPGLASLLDGEPGRVVAAVRAELLAGAGALSGDHEEGRQRFVDAVRRWRDLGADFERALCQVSMVAALGTGPETAEAAAEARETFQRLRATRFVDRLDDALSGSGDGVRSA